MKKAKRKRVPVGFIILISIILITGSLRVSKAAYKGYVYREAQAEASYPYSDGLGAAIKKYFYMKNSGASKEELRDYNNFMIEYYNTFGKDDNLSKAGLKHFKRLAIVSDF